MREIRVRDRDGYALAIGGPTENQPPSPGASIRRIAPHSV